MSASDFPSAETFEREGSPGPYHYRTNRSAQKCCRRELPRSLGADQLNQLALVTHLKVRELQAVDQLFCLLIEISHAIGEKVYTRKAPTNERVGNFVAHSEPGEKTDAVYVLTTRQLQRLPEFSQNVFLERLVRVVSETGEDTVTLLELIDIYSALSRRASFEWSAWVLFCVFDFDEDGMLGSADLYRAIRHMIVGTKSMRFSSGDNRTDAVVMIQSHFRGRRGRRHALALRSTAGKRPILPLGRSPTFTEAYVRRILAKCQSVERDVMDFRYFEMVLRKCPWFKDNFCVAAMTKPRTIEQLLRGKSIAKLAKTQKAHIHQVATFLDVEGHSHWETVIETVDEHQPVESAENPLHHPHSSSLMWNRNDALAKKMRVLDRRVKSSQQEAARSLFSVRVDDHDAEYEITDEWKPYGAMGTKGAGMRPPILATRLLWVGMDMRMLRMLHARGGAEEKSHLTQHVSDSIGYESDGVEQILHEFARSRKRLSAVRYLLKSVYRKLEKLHHGLWANTLADISHKHGAGIMELAAIMKWMLSLNFVLGMMWMVLVIFPRDLGVDVSIHDSVVAVILSMVVDGSDKERNLFYDGFERKQGIFEHMDVFYFTTIVATLVISLGAMLHKLGKIHSGGQSTTDLTDTGMEWATILGAYDFTQVDQDSAIKMRQSIRSQIEDFHTGIQESLLIERLEQSSWADQVRRVMRLRTGEGMTYLLLAAYSMVWFWMLNNESVLKNHHVLLAPAILAALNVSSPPIIKLITLFERRAKSIEIMEVCVKRIFRVKIVQLLTIYYTIFKIMSSAYVQSLHESSEWSNSTNSTEIHVVDDERNDLRQVEKLVFGNSTIGANHDECPEARTGAIFLHQLIMDAVVFITIQYSYLYLVNIGIPNLFTWHSTVHDFDDGATTDMDKTKLHRLRVKHTSTHTTSDGTTFDHVFSSVNAKAETQMRWYMVQPHKRGRWYKQALISIVLEHLLRHATIRGEGTKEDKLKRMVAELGAWRESVENHNTEQKEEMSRSDFRLLAHRAATRGLLGEGGGSRPFPRDQTLEKKHREADDGFLKLAKCVRAHTRWFSLESLEQMPEQLLETVAEGNEVDAHVLSDFRVRVGGFKGDLIDKIQNEPEAYIDLHPDDALISPLQVTSDTFIQNFENTLLALARDVVELEQADDETIKQRLDAKPEHRERRGCCSSGLSYEHKTSLASEVWKQQRPEETPDQCARRLAIASLLKADVQYGAPPGKNRGPIHELRTQLSALTAAQVCVMIESVRAAEEKAANDTTGVVVKFVSLDQAASWRYHRFYLNQSIASWVAGVTVPLDVGAGHGSTSTKQMKNLNRETQDALVAALAKNDIFTIGELIESQMDDDSLRQLFRAESGNRLPTRIAGRLRAAQGEWTDVTQAVDHRRWIRMPQTELKHDESASLIIGMLWRQVFVWVGSPFCPWLPLIAFLLQTLMLTSLRHGLLYGRYSSPKHPWAAGATTQLFMRFGMQTLLLCVLPITMWLNITPNCGPHVGIPIASTYSYFEEEVLVPLIDEQVAAGKYLAGAKLLYSTISFFLNYLMNSTFLLLCVFTLWTRVSTRHQQLKASKAKAKRLKNQLKSDSGYLQSRLRAAKKHHDREEGAKAIHLEQQKMHQYVLATMNEDMKSAFVPNSKRSEHVGLTHTDDIFSKITTRIWPLSDHCDLAPRQQQYHVPVIWMVQDTSVPNFTQFTVRVNDVVVVPPKLQRNDLCGDVPGEDHVFVLTFPVPADIATTELTVLLTITAPDANCGQKLSHALPYDPVPNYQYKCEIVMQGKPNSLLVELNDFSGLLDNSVDGLSTGELALGQQRWVVKVPLYREVSLESNEASTHHGASTFVVEYQVELWSGTVESRDEPCDYELVEEKLQGQSHKQLVDTAKAVGIQPQTISRINEGSPKSRRSLLVEAIVAAETDRPKKQVLTLVPGRRIAAVWQRFSTFKSLYNALRTCVHEKDLKNFPPEPLRLTNHFHVSELFASHHGHRANLLEERRWNVEACMRSLVSSSLVCASRNPYLLSFMGMFAVNDVESSHTTQNAQAEHGPGAGAKETAQLDAL